MKLRSLLNILISTALLFPAGATNLGADTISHPVSIAVPTGMNGELDSKPVSVAVPTGMAGELDSRPVSIALPVTTVDGTYMGRPMTVSVRPENQGDPDLVGLWHMDGDWGDSSGNNLHGVPVNGVAFNTNARVGSQAGSFDGSNDYVKIKSSAVIANSAQSTMEAWVNPASFAASPVIYSENTSGIAFSFGIITSGQVQFAVWRSEIPGNWVGVASSTAVPLNTWSHVAATLDATGMKVYINGVLSATNTANILPSNATVSEASFGRAANGGGTYYFNGLIDEVTIYKRALIAEEIAFHANAIPGDPAVPPSPVLDPVPAIVSTNTITLSGAKTIGTSIWVNGKKIAPLDNAETWQGTYGTLQPGTNLLNIVAVDATSKQSPSVSKSVIYDDAPPVIESSYPANNSDTAKAVTSITINLTDDYSAIDLDQSMTGATVKNSAGQNIPGAWSKSGTKTIIFTPSTTPLPSDTYLVTIYPVDAVGNKGQQQIAFTNHDISAPVTNVSVSGTRVNDGWYYSAVSVTLTASDGAEGSGIDKIEYSLDGTTWQTYSAPFALDKDGVSTLSYRSSDKTGNVETVKITSIKINKTGLVGLWHMDNDWQDASIAGNHGSLASTATFTSNAKIGTYAGSFNGSNAYVSIPDAPTLHAERAFTAMGWIYVNSLSNTWQTIFWKGNTPDCTTNCENREYGLWINSTGYLHFASTPEDRIGIGQLTVSTPAGTIKTASNTPENNGWYHFAAVVSSDQNFMKIFVNGVEQATGSYSAANVRDTSGPLLIGAQPGPSVIFNGVIDELSIYKRVLSETEIQENYRSYSIAMPTVDLVSSPTTSASITLSGTKPVDTAIVVNGNTLVSLDATTTWQAGYTLQPGMNNLNITAMDADGFHSPAVVVSIALDVTPPAIASTNPVNNGVFNTTVGSITFNLLEAFSAIDFAATLNNATVKSASGFDVSGSWSTTGTGASGTVTFTPSSALTEGTYTATITPTDTFGNQGTSTLTFTVDMMPPQPPTIDPIVLPSRTTTKIISGTKSSDSARVVVTCPGTTVGAVSYPTTLTWSVTVSGLHEGSNTITAYAVDAAVNQSASTQMTFIVDTVAPAVPVVNPPTTPTKNNSITLTGTKESGSYLVVNNVRTTVPTLDTTWTYPATLAGEGANTFIVVAQDEAGNSSPTVTVTIVRDTTAPRILSSTPAINGSINQLSTVDIVLIDDNSSVDLLASLANAALKNSSNSVITGTWSVQNNHLIFTPGAALPEGSYSVTIVPVDVLGNTTSLTYSFIIDIGPPTVQLLTMTPTSPHKAEAVTFAITFSEEMQTTVQPVVTFTRGLLYATYTVTGNWINNRTWQGSYPFATSTGDGTYTVTVSGAKDKAGNTMAEAQAGTFVLDTTPPPAPGLDPVTSPTNNRNQLIKGGKEAGSAIFINNTQRVPQDSTSTWTYSFPLSEGTNTLSIAARDTAGNNSTPTTATIVLDTTPPVFTIDMYKNPSSTATQTLAGAKEPNSVVKLNGTQIFDSLNSSPTWFYTVALTSGITNHFAFTAADALGNTTTKAIDILYDNAPPAPLGPGVLVADGSGKGTEATLSWAAYPETTDTAYYAVYKSSSIFTDVTGMTPIGTVNKGAKTYKATGLTLGVTYYFAVTAVDLAGNQINTVTAVAVSPIDTMAPEDVTNLVSTASYTSGQGNTITLTWTLSANSVGDLTDQVVYFDSGTGYDSGTLLGKTATTYTKTNLNDAATYKFKITVKDSSHESVGAITQAVTRLNNPTNLTATPQSAKATLTWSAISGSYVKQYNIYRMVSATPQTNISAMTLIKSITGATTYTDIGLTNGATYQYAVTVVNTSGAERTDVQSVSLTPRSDTANPVIDSVSVIANQVVTAPITITASAHDVESAMGAMELFIDGTNPPNPPLLKGGEGGLSLSWFWNTVATTDGNHIIKLKATDSLGNATEDTRTVIVSLAPPAMPAITSHVVSQTTPTYLINVSGTAPLYTTVTLKVNGIVVSQPATRNAEQFTFTAIQLTEGDNVLSAKASHRGGESQYSPDYRIRVDTGAPPAPQGLSGQLLPGGLIRFTWIAASGEVPAGYNLYRGTSAFTTKAEATKTNTSLITPLYKEYNPGDDNFKYYAVTAVDSAGNESPISNVISLSSDRVAPSVVSITYVALPFTGDGFSSGINPDATITGIGTVKVSLTVSEALKELPFISFEPTAGSPIVLTMKKLDDTHYEGSFSVTADTPHGPTTYKFSAKDMVGNRGNAQGSGIVIDVKGPIASIQSPQSVLKITTTPAPLQIVFDEAVIGTPILGLKASDSNIASITNLVTTDSGVHWTGSVDISGLPEGQAEFVLTEAKDALNNTGTTVSAGKIIFLYTNTVPPPGVPANLAAKSDKGGKILLTWQSVTGQGSWAQGQVTYNLYRRAEGESTSTRIQANILDPSTLITPHPVVAQDTPDQDGNYYYTVTSVGLLGSESPASAEVAAISDRMGPAAPTNLALILTGNGIASTWSAVSDQQSAVSYKLYRANAPITTTAGLTPVATVAAVTATDTGPTKLYPYYAVASVDALGNEGSLSESVHITFPVLPVRNLTLTRIEQAAPQLAWEAPADGSAVGYYLYRNDNRIIETAITDRMYTDGYYAGGSVAYAITALDSEGNESPKKAVTLPDFSIKIKDNTTLRRGLLETAPIIITNAGSGNALTIDSLDIKAGDAPQSTLSGPLDVPADGQLQVEKVLATTSNAPSTVGILTTATWSPAPGTTVKAYQTTTASIIGASTAFEIYSDPLVRGTSAKIRLKINNLGTAQMEVPTSENGGATNKVKVNLKDEDNNILATGLLNQRTGPVVNIGTAAVARINPGESFTSDAITFDVPASAPYNVTLEAVISNTYYHYTKPDQVTAPGMTQSMAAPITDTSYRATAAPDKTFYASVQPVLITGQAISNAGSGGMGQGSEILMPFVPVKIGITTRGFDRLDTVTTDSQGNFTYTFTPGANEAGTFTLWAAHPEVSTRMVQATFTIAGLQVDPQTVNLRMVKNTSLDIPIKLKNTGATPLVNLNFTKQASQGITANVNNTGSTTIAAGETRTVTLRVSADSTAPDTGTTSLVATLNPEGQAGEITGKVDAGISLISAIPIITTNPSYIDTGMVRGDQKIAQFTITNTGATSLMNAKISAPSTSWMTLVTGDTIAELKPNASTTVSVMFRPPDILSQAVYDDQLIITSDNHIPYTFHIQVTVTSNAVGSVYFDVLDQLMQRVPNATITFQHQTLLELMYTIKTSADGMALQTDIPEGRYTYNISALGHKSTAGTFIVYPGITTTVPIGMEVTLVEVEWSVVPIVIQDKYEIQITQTFKTNVPTPVLITEPPVVNLPDMQAGEVFNGEFTVTNYGLVAADNPKILFPSSFLDYDVEILSNTMPAKIGAMQKITVQYRVTKRTVVAGVMGQESAVSGEQSAVNSQYAFNTASTHQPINPLPLPLPPIHASTLFSEVQGYGGSCVSSFSIGVSGSYVMCPDTPQQSTGSANTGQTVSVPVSCGTSVSGGGGVTGYVSGPGTGGGGQGSSGGWGGGGVPTALGGEDECGVLEIPDNKNGPTVCTNSMVNMSGGTYEDGVTDIEVKTNGIPITLERFYTSRWKKIGEPRGYEYMMALSPGSGKRGYTIRKSYDSSAGGARLISGGTTTAMGTPETPPAQAYGWTSPWFAKIQVLSYVATYFDGYGRLIYFIKKRDGSYGPGVRAEQFVAEAGLQMIATATGFQLRDKSGIRRNFASITNNDWYYLVSMEDAHGNKVIVDYDASNKPISIIDTTGTAALKFTYNDKGFISRAEDRDGRGVDYTVDDQGRLLAAYVPVAGNATESTPKATYEYDEVNGYSRVLKKTDAEGHVTSIEYQPGKLTVTKVTEPNGATRTFSYNFPGYTFYYTDSRGNQTTYIVNRSGKLVSVSKAGHLIKIISYFSDRVEKVQDEHGNIQTIKRNEKYDPISIIDAKGNETKITYNQYWKVASITDPLGNVTTFEYNQYEELISVTYPDGSQTVLERDSLGNVITLTKGTGAEASITRYEYDSRGNVTKVTDAEGGITLLGYDQYAHVNKITDARGNVTSITNDILGHPLTVQDALGNSKTYTYDTKGNVLSATDEAGNITTYTYDFKGRVMSAINAKGIVTKYTYDGEGRLTEIKEATGTPDERATKISYDVLNRKETITDPMNNVTRYEYQGSTTGCATCKGGSTEIPAKITDPLGNVTSLTFDENGKVIGVKDRNGNQTSMSYDAVGRLTSKTYPDQSSVSYTYDAFGRLLTAANVDTTLTFTYDTLGRVKSSTDSRLNKTISYEYDKNGNRIKMTDPEGRVTNYTYNADRLLTSISLGTLNYTFAYDTMGRRSSLAYPNGITATYAFDPVSNLASFIARNPQLVTTSSNTYTYSSVRNRTSMADLVGTHSYEYDAISQLTKATHPDIPTEAYTYSKIGNRIIESRGTTTTSYTHIAGNRIQMRGNETYTHDKNGNIINVITSAGTTTYSYDYENRLINAAMSDGTTAAYKYDLLGRRIEKAVKKCSPPDPCILSTVSYLYDGDNILYEYDEANAVKARYTHNLAIDDPLAMEKGGQVYFYHKDALGSITSITDASGDVVQTYEYDAFGNITNVKDPTFIQPYTFTGREYDAETGNYHYRARTYNAVIGRFMQEDPIGFRGGDVNLFRYVGNSAQNWIDPWGLFIFGKRPLSGLPWMPIGSSNPIDNYSNTELSHEHGFFEDGTGDNVGFGPHGRFTEDPTGKGYRYDNKHYDDALMRDALRNITDGTYSNWPWNKNNCQDWADRLREEYERLKNKKDKCQ